ncbi:MAG TPA: hypothetical protein VEC76_11965 [Streptosporangiaceae bacterium]|nr:hypothetical protein [Streptosporangiaceae bacterium]
MNGQLTKLTAPAIDVRRQAIPLLLAVAGWLVLALTVLVDAPGLRTAAVFAFALAGPGTALIRLLPLRDPLERAVLAVALSASLATLLAEAAAIGHFWHPTAVLAALAALCSAAAVAELRGVRL